MEGILRSGKLSGASIKAKIKLVDAEDGDEEDVAEPEAPALMAQNNQKKPDAKGGGDNSNKWEKINDACKELAEEFPFDIFNDMYLQQLTNDYESYRIRVYLISA